MATKGQLSFWDCRHIEEILDDPAIVGVLLMNGEKGRHIFVSVDGKITIGRTQYSWLNWLFKDTKVIDFELFALKVANALAGQAKNRNETLFQKISQEVLKHAIADNDFHYVTDALYDTLRYGMDCGEHRSSFFSTNVKKDLPDYRQRTNRASDRIVGEIRSNSGEVMIPRVEIEYFVR